MLSEAGSDYVRKDDLPVPDHRSGRLVTGRFDPQDARFDGLRYWRGPVWGIMNMMAGTGMAEAGMAAEAARIRADTVALIDRNGFAEYFDPRDGTPAGGGTFTWTAAIWLGWASPSAEEG